MATTASLPSYMLPGVPVHQPAHLEGDPNLATEILPGPPSLVSAQQSAQKRDPRKPSTAYSYLPLSDPGSTYSGVMHGTLIGHEEPRSKRRADKGISGRAQRASARNHNAVTMALDPSSSMDTSSGSGLQPIVLDAEAPASVGADDEITLSRSNSSLNLQDAPPQISGGKASQKDKGKGKEVGTPPIRVKEEPKNILLYTPEPSINLLNNNDHCSSCRSNGALVYCDGCPRAFHLWCLDPPMESIDEGDSRWFCPSCTIRKHPPRRPPPSLLSPLIYQVETSIPLEFQLPEDIRTFFRDVAAGPKGTYVDSTEVKPPRLNRHGQLEDRDPYRLRDRNGAPVLCFQCGMSAIPAGLASAVPTAKRPRRAASKAATPDAWKSIVSCDYCNLHWHLDCLNPPLPSMPPFNKKWMCPNHAERLLPSKRRIPKQNAPPVEITKPRQYNNGNIDVTQTESSSSNPPKPKVQVDEVLINGRRYRVPEKIIILDFWNRLSKHNLPEDNRELEIASGLSSPLTSLSSLDDLDELTSEHPSPPSDIDELQAAQLLFNFSRTVPAPTVRKKAPKVKSVDRAVQTNVKPPAQPVPAIPVVPSRPSRTAKKAASLRISSAMNADLNGIEKLTPSSSASVETPVTVSFKPRRRPPQPVQPETSTRELRSRSRNNTQDSSSTSVASLKTAVRIINDLTQPDSSISAPVNNGPKYRTISVKMEEMDSALSLSNGPESASTSTSAAQMTPKKRITRRPTLRDSEDNTKNDAKEIKDKRGKKRKTRDDELPEVPTKRSETGRTANDKRSKKDRTEAGEGGGSRDKRKVLATPSKPPAIYATPSSTSSRLPPLTPLTATPTLKIRLPRLSSANKITGASIPNGNADTPTRL